MQACFNAYEIFETHHASIVLATGRELPQPPTPLLFEPCKLASKHVSVSESYHASILFANGGGSSTAALF